MEHTKEIKIEEKTYNVPNLERALSIFELLNSQKKEMTMTEIQLATGYPKSSLFRILQTLVDRDYISKDQYTNGFTLSNKFLHLGLSTLSEGSLIEKSLPYMRILRDKFKETILLGSIIDGEGILLEQVLGLHPFTFMLKPGKKFNLHASAPAKAMLSYMPVEEFDNISKKIDFKVFNENTISNIADFKEEIKKTTSNGYGSDIAEELEGVHCLAAPIFNQYGYPIASIWITAPSARLRKSDFENVALDLKKACNQISRQYGYKNINDV